MRGKDQKQSLENATVVNRRKNQLKRKRVLAVLGCVVVLMMALALMVPAISITKDVAEQTEGIDLQATPDADELQSVETPASEEPDGSSDDQGAPEADASAPEQPAASEPSDNSGDQGSASADSGDSSSATASDEKSDSTAATDKDDSKDSADKDDSKDSADKDEADYPARDFKGEVLDGEGNVVMTIMVKAPKGAFPAGTEMQIEALDADSVADKVETAIQNDPAIDGTVKSMTAIDIRFIDKKGKEIEPAKNVEVRITSGTVAEIESPVLVHVVDKSKDSAKGKTADAEVVKKVDVVDEEATDDTLKFKTNEFSPYVIVEMENLTTQVITASGETYNVTVSYAPEANIPEGAELVVTEIVEGDDAYAEYLDQVNGELGSEVGFARFFDITIMADGEAVQPDVPVSVSIELADASELGDGVQAVHFADEGGVEVLDASLQGETVNFTAESFSVYAVVDDPIIVNESRMTLNFYGKDQSAPLATVYVKNDDDTLAEIEQIVYDPGAGTLESGELFKGWILDKENYTTEDVANKMDIAQIRAWALDKATNNEIVEGEVHNFYAMIYKTFSVCFKAEDGVTIHSEALIFLASEGSVDYTVNVPYTPKDPDEAFKGWYFTSTSSGSGTGVAPAAGTSAFPTDTSGHAYVPNDTRVTISDNVTFTVSVPRGYWLSFVENGDGASYTPPQFIQTGNTPEKPANPSRFGYQFDGWYLNAECTGDQFDFGQELTGRTVLYAKWTPNPTANYTVIVWIENIDGSGYDFATMQTLNGSVGSTTSACLTTSQDEDATFATIRGTSSAGGTVNETYDHDWTNNSGITTFKGFTYKEYETNNEDKVTAEGTSVINVYYDRMEYTLKFYYARSIAGGGTTYNYIPVATTNNNGSPTWNAGYSYDANEQYYRDSNGSRAYYRNGVFYQSQNNTRVRNSTIYIREEAGSVQNYQVPYVNSRDETAEAHDGTAGTWRASSTNEPGSSYGGAGTETRGNYTYYYRTLTAKYGTYIGDQWPTYNWIDFEYWTGGGNTQYRQNSWAVMRNSQAYQSQPASSRQGTIKGKITIMDEQILGDLSSTNGNYVYANYDTPGSTYSWIYHIYFQNETGDGYTLYEDVTALSHDSGSNWQTQQKPPAYPGMDNDNIRKELTTGNYNDRQIDYYYDRLVYPVVFMDGQYVNGNGVGIQDKSQLVLKKTNPILYGASVATYNKGEADYYTPARGDEDAYEGFDPTGYVFGGWYIDPTCTTPYTFTTMPLDGVTVYAKWIQKQYRVFLNPNVPTSDNTFDMGGQSTCFRVDYGEKIAGGNTINGTRDDYELIGWYTDAACTHPFNFDAFVLNDTTVTTPYDQTENTELDKYGNVEPGQEGVNSDDRNDRFWIDKKLNLYAKWRAKLEGANGINVVYDAGDGDNAPEDSLTYLDNAEATAGAASTPNSQDKQFLHWVVQKWNGTAYEDTNAIVYPGNTYTVLKENAKVVVTEWVNPDNENDYITVTDPQPGTTPPEGDTVHTKIKTATYTVQLRAEYGDKSAPTPTHIWWFPNDVAVGASHNACNEDNALQINKAVTIPDAPVRDGYTFLGWARVDHTDSGSSKSGENPATGKGLSLTRDDLFLTYHTPEGEDPYYTAEIDGVTRKVKQVAADEDETYHDMYAVWAKSYKVTVKKVVQSDFEDDKSVDFNFTATNNTSGVLTTTAFTLKDGQEKVIENVLEGSTFDVTEDANVDFTTTYSGTYKDAQNQDVILDSVHDFQVQGDTTITVLNKRKAFDVTFAKTDLSDNPLYGSKFKLLRRHGSEYVIYSSEFQVGTDTTNTVVKGLIAGDYKLVETVAPEGCIFEANETTFKVSNQGVVSDLQGDMATLTGPDSQGMYTITVKNKPGHALPTTGGPGTAALTVIGVAMIVVAAIMLITRRRPAATRSGAQGRPSLKRGGR